MENTTASKQASKQASKHFLTLISSGLVAAVLGLGIIIGCICGLVVPSAAADAVFVITSAEKIGEIQLGEYPQTYVGDALNDELKNAVANGKAAVTGKTYTTDVNISQVVINEYRYNNVLYGRLASSFPHSWSGEYGNFSTGETMQNGAEYFFKVEPITWSVFAVNNNQNLVLVSLQVLESRKWSTQVDHTWTDSTMRAYLNEIVYHQITGISNSSQAIRHIAGNIGTAATDEIVTDNVWLLSINEAKLMRADIFPLTSTDFANATYTDCLSSANAYSFTRSTSDPVASGNNVYTINHDTGSWGRANAHFGFQPAFVLNDATAQYKTNTVAATCKDTGYSESWWSIADSDEKFGYTKYNETPIIDHTFGEWQTVTDPTCATNGEQRRTCTVCGYSETEYVPASGHGYVAGDTIAATCGHEGYTEYVCQNCDASYRDNFTPKLAHEWGEWETIKEATATQNGTAERKCALCGATEQKTLPATAPVTGTTSNGGDNSSTVWLIFGIIAGGVLVLGGGAVSWLFIAGRQRKKQVAVA